MTTTPAIDDVRSLVAHAMAETPVFDLHTHLFAPGFRGLQSSGIDDLLTYHYLVAEALRWCSLQPEAFFALPRSAQADLVWQTLFVDRSPLSEAASGVVTVLAAFGLDPGAKDLTAARAFFAARPIERHVDDVFALAGVTEVVMTNDPFDRHEAQAWQDGLARDRRFHAALRMDPLVNGWPNVASRLADHGFPVEARLAPHDLAQVRTFVERWIQTMRPLYLAVSLPDDFTYPDDTPRTRILDEVVAPLCREHGLPFAMMIGVRRGANPRLGLAGDAVGRAEIRAVEQVCARHPDTRFLVTMLSRENQHELCVAARKFANLMPFGCWWFTNTPLLVEEITRLRLELLGTSFVPQHSDARVLEQLIYKWRHSRRAIASALTTAYERLVAAGRPVSAVTIRRDVDALLSGNARAFLGLEGGAPQERGR